MAQTLRWGILGTGNIAQQFARGVAGSRRGALAAVGSRGEASARAFAGEFHVPRSSGSYADVLKTADVDAVYVALPNAMHHEWTIAALKAGKHVLCEKPIASNAAEAAEMFDVARQTGRVLVEAFMYRSHPLTLAVVEAVRSGAIGELKLIRSSFCFRTRRIEGNIRFSRPMAGGSLMDVGCYCVNFSRLFAGCEPIRVEVTGHLHESGVDDLAAGVMSFPNGVFAHFACGMTLHADNAAYLCGTEGYIEIPVPWKPAARDAVFTLARGTPPRMDRVGQPAPTAPPAEVRTVSAGADLYALEVDDFAATVLDGQPPRVSAEDSIGNMRVLDRMREQLGIV